MHPPLHGTAAEILNDQKDALMQILAALILSDESPEESEDEEAEENIFWAQSMKADLMENRDKLLQVLKKHGFLTNTHAGFCLGPLLDSPENTPALGLVYQDIDALASAYASGVGPPMSLDSYKDDVKAELVDLGHNSDLVDYALEREGESVILQAFMTRHLAKSIPYVWVYPEEGSKKVYLQQKYSPRGIPYWAAIDTTLSKTESDMARAMARYHVRFEREKSDG